MNKGAKITILMSLLLIFVVTKVLCCCLVKESLAAFKKANCSHCSTKASHGASSGCCLLKVSPMELAKNIYLPPPLLLLFILVSFVFLSIRRRSASLLSSIYLNGPPGFVRTVPLYIQSRSIRI